MENTNIRKFELVDHLPIIHIQEKNTLKEELEDTKDLKYLRNMLQEDFEECALENISEEKIKIEIKRYQKIVKELKKRYGSKCQLCGHTFLMDNGKYYCEAHHIIPLSKNGNQNSDNVILLCANHHRMFHYKKDRIKIGELIDKRRIIIIEDEKYDVKF